MPYYYYAVAIQIALRAFRLNGRSSRSSAHGWARQQAGVTQLSLP